MNLLSSKLAASKWVITFPGHEEQFLDVLYIPLNRFLFGGNSSLLEQCHKNLIFLGGGFLFQRLMIHRQYLFQLNCSQGPKMCKFAFSIDENYAKNKSLMQNKNLRRN